MKIIEQSAIIEDWTNLSLYERVERGARVACQSWDRIREGSAEKFCKMLLEKGHTSPFEFARFLGGTYRNGDFVEETRHLRGALEEQNPYELCDIVAKFTPANDWIPVLVTTNRATSHQLVRHRNEIVFMQASQRYCRYDNEKKFEHGVEFIRPVQYRDWPVYCREVFEDVCLKAEEKYVDLLDKGLTAQEARLVLPNATATRLMVYASPKEWKYIFDLRCSDAADPQMRALMIPLRDEMKEKGLI